MRTLGLTTVSFTLSVSSTQESVVSRFQGERIQPRKPCICCSNHISTDSRLNPQNKRCSTPLLLLQTTEWVSRSRSLRLSLGTRLCTVMVLFLSLRHEYCTPIAISFNILLSQRADKHQFITQLIVSILRLILMNCAVVNCTGTDNGEV